jgi:hypothetical protein
MPRRGVMPKYKFTPERAEKLLDFLRLGMDIEEACALCEIDKGTYYYWLKTDKDFNVRAGSARANMKARHLSNIARAGQGTLKTDAKGKTSGKPGDWKADAWLLEKHFPKDYGHIARLQLEGEVTTKLELSNDELTERAKRLLERKCKK